MITIYISRGTLNQSQELKPNLLKKAKKTYKTKDNELLSVIQQFKTIENTFLWSGKLKIKWLPRFRETARSIKPSERLSSEKFSSKSKVTKLPSGKHYELILIFEHVFKKFNIE